MSHAIQWVRSLIFISVMYLSMAVISIAWLPLAMISREWALRGVHLYCRWVRFTARLLCGLRSEVRGTPPEGAVLICAKHQSFFDIILLVSALPRPRFVMKSLLKWAPVFGWYALRMGCVPVDRGKGGKAIKQMVDGVRANADFPGQLIIYPQGTRVAPGVSLPYKIGSAVLYRELGQTCVPVATNVGVFWPRHGIYRKPGLAVVEFLEPIEPGQSQRAFMGELEARIEGASNALMAEAGFVPLTATEDEHRG